MEEQEGVVSLIENRSLTSDEIGLLATLIAEEPDHYTALGVNRDASSAEIQNAYCLAVRYFHPLKSPEITESDSVMHWKLSSAFLRVEEAYTVLSRPSRRKIYDENLSAQASQHSNQRWSQSKSGHMERYQSEKPKPVDNELRRVARVSMRLPVRVSFDRHWQELTETLDVSPLGIRFRLSRPIEPGSELRVELAMPKHLRTHSYDDEVYVAKAFVIYADSQESGRQVVAEFI
jgi:hypothetical protein